MATEDFTTYTEVDPLSNLTVTASQVSASSLQRRTKAYVYDDKGASHFNGDFEFEFELYVSSASVNSSYFYGPLLSNSIGSFQDIFDANGDILGAFVFRVSSVNRFYVVETNDGAYNGSSSYLSLALNTQYYCTLIRDESIGSYGRLMGYVYSDPNRTAEVGSVYVDLTEKQDFRYCYAMSGRGDTGTEAYTGTIDNLDLQETVQIPTSLPVLMQHYLRKSG